MWSPLNEFQKLQIGFKFKIVIEKNYLFISYNLIL
jgi:hypothetical protein